jgi:hypothetical protein
LLVTELGQEAGVARSGELLHDWMSAGIVVAIDDAPRETA